MTIIKTTELTGAALDWAVAKSEKLEVYWVAGDQALYRNDDNVGYSPSTYWAQGGPIIEHEEIMVYKRVGFPWTSAAYRYGKHKKLHGTRGCTIFYGRDEASPLVAAMRCYVASKLGDEVDVPEELSQ